MDTSSPLLAHFRSTSGHFQSTSGSLPVHLGIIGGHIRHHSYSSPKKMNFPKSADIRTYIHTDGRKKNVTPKDPLRINARDLKNRIKWYDTFRQASHYNLHKTYENSLKKVDLIFIAAINHLIILTILIILLISYLRLFYVFLNT